LEAGGLLYDFDPPLFAEIVVYDSPKISVSQQNVSVTGNLSRIPVKFCLQDTFKGFSQGRTSAMPPAVDQNIVARHGCILHVRCSLLSLIYFLNLWPLFCISASGAWLRHAVTGVS